MNWYKRYMGDYGIKTACLSLAERGAYDALLDEYYTKEQPLPKDKQELYRIVRAFERWERAAVDRVLAKFFSLTSAGYTNPRAEEELAKYKKAADIHRANGSRHTTKLLPNRNLKPVEILDTRSQIQEENTNTKTTTRAQTARPESPPCGKEGKSKATAQQKSYAETASLIRSGAEMLQTGKVNTLPDLKEELKRLAAKKSIPNYGMQCNNAADIALRRHEGRPKYER